jgi:hypothetical protein
MRCAFLFSLYARDHGFILKRKGADESAEFATIFDAIAYIENLPQSGGSTLCIHNELGHKIGQLLLNCGTLRVRRVQHTLPKRGWPQTPPDSRN